MLKAVFLVVVLPLTFGALIFDNGSKSQAVGWMTVGLYIGAMLIGAACVSLYWKLTA